MRARVLLSLAALHLLLVGLAGTDPADAAERPEAFVAERWLAPVRGEPTRRFHLGPDPFLGGQHRGVDLAAYGGPVRAACAGRVVFAGRVAASPTVSMRCGRWRVSYAPLERVGVREGARVGAGARLGRAGRELHFGVRREGRRFGYVDPLGFLAVRRTPPPPVAVPPPERLPRRREARPPPSARAFSQPVPTLAPWPVWLGLALLLTGLLGGGRLQLPYRRQEGASCRVSSTSSSSPTTPSSP